VVRRQIRIAGEAGVHVVGVGISCGCYAVTNLFPLHVAVSDVSNLPQSLLGVLDSIMFPRRGGKIQLDSKIGNSSGAFSY